MDELEANRAPKIAQPTAVALMWIFHTLISFPFIQNGNERYYVTVDYRYLQTSAYVILSSIQENLPVFSSPRSNSQQQKFCFINVFLAQLLIEMKTTF